VSRYAPTLSVIAQGVKQTTLNGRTFTYGPGQFLVVSVDLPVIGHVTRATVEEPFLAFVLELRPERIAALLLETAPAAASGAETVDPVLAGLAVSDASPALIDVTVRMLALLDAPEDAAALALGLERGILWRLLTGPQGATVRQIGLADSRLAHLARAIRWIRGHYNETLRVEQLAALATMSVSSFHRHFRAVTSMTPIQYQKQIRLREARARLLADPGDITGVGFAVGYTARRSSAANTGACSACRPAATRSRCARPPYCPRSSPPLTHEEPAIAHGPRSPRIWGISSMTSRCLSRCQRGSDGIRRSGCSKHQRRRVERTVPQRQAIRGACRRID
jgi:AraC-like DNA-binding protein